MDDDGVLRGTKFLYLRMQFSNRDAALKIVKEML